MGSGILISLLISIWLAIRLRKHLKQDNKYFPQVSKSATVISIGGGSWIFAGFLGVQAILNHYASSIEAKQIAMAKEQEKVEKSSPDYQKRQLRAWLDKLGYSSKDLGESKRYAFSIDVAGRDVNFVLRQEKEQPDVLVLETRIDPKPEVLAKLVKMNKDALEKLFIEMEVELLRQRVEMQQIRDYDKNFKLVSTFTVIRHEFPYEREKQISFVREFLHFKAAREILNTSYRSLGFPTVYQRL